MEKDLIERVVVLETYIQGKGGLIERLNHLDDCIDRLKGTVWKATGAIGVVVVFLQWALKSM